MVPRNFCLEIYFISRLNDCCQRKKPPENGYLDISRLMRSYIRQNQRSGVLLDSSSNLGEQDVKVDVINVFVKIML